MSRNLKNSAAAVDDSATSHSSDDDYITIEKRSKKNQKPKLSTASRNCEEYVRSRQQETADQDEYFDKLTEFIDPYEPVKKSLELQGIATQSRFASHEKL